MSINVFEKYWKDLANKAPTPQNGQTHPNKSSTNYQYAANLQENTRAEL